MTTLVSLIFIEKIVNGIIFKSLYFIIRSFIVVLVLIMLVTKKKEDYSWIYWMLNLFSWICISFFSIVQVLIKLDCLIFSNNLLRITFKGCKAK
jgi:hypothetical protein